MRNQLFDALKKSTADYTEIRFEKQVSTRFIIQKSDIEQASYGNFQGGIVRACKNGGWGISVFDDISKIDEHLEEACKCAQLVGKEKTNLFETPIIDEEIKADGTGQQSCRGRQEQTS